jgi:hypothetical protein
VASYLRTETAGRAWFLQSDGHGLVQRWHAKCVAESDFAAVQGKRRPVHDKHSCDCGAAVENMAHVHLRCPLYGKFRAPFALLLDEFTSLANRTQGAFGLPGIAGREEALHWIHHDQPAPLVDLATQTKGDELRSAALAFYSQVQHERHVTGRSTRMPNPQPEYLVEPEHAHLLAPFANPNPL